MELLDPTDAPTPAQFRKRPVVITAFQWQGDFDALDAWLNALGYSEDGDDGQDGDPGGMREDHNTAGETLLVIPTLEGEMTAKPGDWIIRGVKGEFYPCKPDIFAATYERADAAASPFPIRAHAVGCDHALSIPVDRCSCNGRDFIPTQAIDAQITRVLTTDAVLHPSPTEADLAQFADAAASSAQSQEEWTPTPEHVNALPLPIRSYIYQLETECDPSGSLRELVIARDTIRALEVLAAGARAPQPQDKTTGDLADARSAMQEIGERLAASSAPSQDDGPKHYIVDIPASQNPPQQYAVPVVLVADLEATDGHCPEHPDATFVTICIECVEERRREAVEAALAAGARAVPSEQEEIDRLRIEVETTKTLLAAWQKRAMEAERINPHGRMLTLEELEPFITEMRERTIPAIVKAVSQRQKDAAAMRHIPLSACAVPETPKETK